MESSSKHRLGSLPSPGPLSEGQQHSGSCPGCRLYTTRPPPRYLTPPTCQSVFIRQLLSPRLDFCTVGSFTQTMVFACFPLCPSTPGGTCLREGCGSLWSPPPRPAPPRLSGDHFRESPPGALQRRATAAGRRAVCPTPGQAAGKLPQPPPGRVVLRITGVCAEALCKLQAAQVSAVLALSLPGSCCSHRERLSLPDLREGNALSSQDPRGWGLLWPCGSHEWPQPCPRQHSEPPEHP